MKKKIVTSLVLTAAMATGLLAGCGSSSATTTSTADAGSSAESASETDVGASGTESDTAGTESADSGEKKTFDVATVRWTDAWPIDFLENGVMKQLEDQAGVDINWQVYYNADWSEQKSLLLASGDLPDAFLGSISLNASDMLQNKESFIDLTDYINEDTMPNLTAAMEKEPSLRAICTSRDGKIYSLPKKLPLRPKVCGDVMYINQDWLDNLGLEMPTNIDELEKVLVAFGTQDADGDGDPADNFGISNSASTGLLSGDLRHILSPFGTMVSRDGNYMGLNADGEPVFVPAEDNYKQAVEWMHKLWEEGAIDPEYFTQESSATTAKMQAEGGSKVGVVYGWTADAQVGTNAGQYSLVPAIEGYDGTHYVESASNYLDIADRELVITTQCEDPEALLKWADGFYDDLVSLQTFYGSIPDQVTDNGDGTYTVNTPSDGSSLDTSAWSNSLRDFGPKYMDPSFYDKVNLPSDQGDGVKLAEDEVNEKYVTDDKNCGLPMMQYTEDEKSRITTIGTDIYQYVEAQYAHWVVDGGVDEEWDSYIDQLNQMGLEELIQIHRDAYNVYKENMNE